MNKNDMNWIRQEKRLALYLRDGLACVYCGQTIEDKVSLTLDHLTPRTLGGNNAAENLVTCCWTCNTARNHRPLDEFAQSVAGYVDHDVTPQSILDHVEDCRRRPLPKAEAKALMARRGSARKAAIALITEK